MQNIKGVCVCVCVLAYYQNFYFILHNIKFIEHGPLLSHILHRVCLPNSSHRVCLPNSSHRVCLPNSSHRVCLPNSSHRVCLPNSSHSSQDRTFYFYLTDIFFQIIHVHTLMICILMLNIRYFEIHM